MSSVTVLELADPSWADFVASQPGATPFHHPDWARLIADCYRFRAFAVAASDTAGRIQAGLPVIEVRHLLGERKWVSLPFTDYCAPLVSDPQGEAGFASALRQASEAAGVRRVEIRGPLKGLTPMSRAAFRHVIRLEGCPEQVYARFRRAARQQIRQAEKNGVTLRQAARPEDLTDTFYRLHLRNRRRVGVPVQPRRFFRLLWDSVIGTGLGLVLIAEVSGRPIAAHVYLAWNGTMTAKFSASHEGAWLMRPNQLLFWHSIKAACEQGCHSFDFGRTDACNEGLRAFKRSWGAAEEPLVYGTLGAGAEPAPSGKAAAGQLLGCAIRHTPPVVCRAFGEALYRYSA